MQNKHIVENIIIHVNLFFLLDTVARLYY